ncbi:MAG: HAMP domain-containing histidine kinase [Elusimicrobia bacterium]|nr:HAMP domain-containing histidine kinase [Elusimicrobiota bacterium]
MDFSSKSLRTKTIFFSLILTSFILCAAFSFICFREVTFVSRQLAARIETENRISSSLIQQNYGLGNIIELRRTLDTLSESIKLDAAEFSNDNGESLWKYQPAEAAASGKTGRPGIFSSLLIKTLKQSDPLLDIRGGQVYCRTKIEFVNGAVLGYFSWNFSARSILSEALGRLGIIFAAFLALVVFFVALVYRFSSVILKPLPDFIEKIQGEFRKLNMPRKEIKISDMDFLNRAFDDLVNGWKKAQAEALESSRLAAIGELAAQVAHDIRSPLAALDAALSKTDQLPEKQRVMVRHAVNRIRDIANNLLEKNRQQVKAAPAAGSSVAATGEPPEIRLLSSLIDPVITEKRLQFESRLGVNIDFELTRESYGLFARVQPVEFRRVVSNLVNNAVEVLGDKGKVAIGLAHDEGNVILTVADNGKGISPEILAKLGQMGETHGKAGGSGLGLFHAKTIVESWGGSLVIASELGKGATVSIKLPKAEAPESFVPALELVPGGLVVALDDDAAIHQVWQGRFDSARVQEHNIEVIHFSEPDKLREWVKNNVSAESALYLFDYELAGYKETGLSLAEELGVSGRTMLVTSRCEEGRIIEECKRLKVRMIPKGLAGLVPISVKSPAKTAQAVLIDDDALVRMNWGATAEEAGIDLKIFSEPGGFLSNLTRFSKDTPIYIDSELGNDIKGENIAVDLREKGFTDITLETGHAPERFAHLPWLKVIDKESPWGR